MSCSLIRSWLSFTKPLLNNSHLNIANKYQAVVLALVASYEARALLLHLSQGWQICGLEKISCLFSCRIMTHKLSFLLSTLRFDERVWFRFVSLNTLQNSLVRKQSYRDPRNLGCAYGKTVRRSHKRQ